MTTAQNSTVIPTSIDEKQIQLDLREITECLNDIRQRTGYGRIVIDLRGGEIIEMEISYKRRPKLEAKHGDIIQKNK